jgi:dihydroorotase
VHRKSGIENQREAFNHDGPTQNGKETLKTLIQGGLVYDGGGESAQRVDVRIDERQILEIGSQLPVNDDVVFDAHDLIVAPGLIDLHVHVYDGTGIFSVSPANAGLRTGVTTLLDTGSAGALTYETFHNHVMPEAAEDIFALLNISQVGALGNHNRKPFFGELHDLRYLDTAAAASCIEKHRDRLLGTKVRLTAGLADNQAAKEYAALHAVVTVAEQTGLPCMIHHGASHVPQSDMLGALRTGDIVTHMYHGRADNGFSGPNGAPSAAMQRAREQGILFDVGHGMGSFAWRVAEVACQQHDFWPDSISSDLHRMNIDGPVYNLTTTMTKFLHLGMSLEKVIQATTSAPAKAMGLDDQRGRLRQGMLPDITILRLANESIELVDVEQQARIASQRLLPVTVFKQGRIVNCSA